MAALSAPTTSQNNMPYGLDRAYTPPQHIYTFI